MLIAQSWPTLCDPMDCSLPGSPVHGNSLGKNTGVGCHALLQGIFPTQGLNPGLQHCTHSSVLAWRIPGTGDPGGLPTMGSHRVRHDWSDLAAAAAAALLTWRYLIEKRLQCTFWCSVAKSRLTLCNPKDWSTTGFPVLHYLPEFAQTHVYWVNDTNQGSHSLSMYLMIHKF